MTVPRPLVIFDLDGTLAETAGDLMNALNHVLAGEGIPALPVSQARTLLGAGGRALIERGFAVGGRSLDAERREVLFRQFLSFYEAHIADETTLFPGAVEALDALEADGFAFAVCTNKMTETSRRLLDILGVADRFGAICGQDFFPFHKPDGRVLPAVVEAAGGAIGLCVMVGDSVTDIMAAKNAAVPVIAVDFGYTDKPVGTLGPDRVISHFDALPGAVRDLLRSGSQAASAG